MTSTIHSHGTAPWRTLVRLSLISLCIGALMPLGLVDPAPAQTPEQQTDGDDGNQDPIEIFADNGIEWRKDVQMYIARGNAVAVQGEDRYYGDVLIAYYREKGENQDGTDAGTDNAADNDGGEGGTEIYRMEARGNVIIVQPDRITTGDLAVRDMDRNIMWVTGNDLRMETSQDIVIARDSLEYWADQDIAVARGDAVNYKPAEERTIRADVLTSYFVEPEGHSQAEQVGSVGAAPPETPSSDANAEQETDGGGIQFMTAHGNVVVVTPQEVVYGDEGTYDPQTAIAVVLGDVKVTTETDQMDGTRAVINTRTGVRTLEGGRGTRARALLQPADTSDDDGTTNSATDANTGAGSTP